MTTLRFFRPLGSLVLAYICVTFGQRTALAAPLTLAFDDVTITTVTASGFQYGPVPNGYGGLQWQNFLAMDTRYGPYPNTGYKNGVVSPSHVAFNGDGSPSRISGGLFDLISGYFTGAWNDSLSLEVKGYWGATLKYDQSYLLSSTAPTLLTLNYTGVDSVQFISSGGIEHGYGGGGTQFAMDNLVVVVPEPCATTLWLLGMAMFCGRVLSKRNLNVARRGTTSDQMSQTMSRIKTAQNPCRY